MQIKYTYIIVISLIALSGVLAYDAFTSYVNPYLTVSQVTSNSENYIARKVQIIGTVVNGTSQIGDGTLRFNLTDGKNLIHVTYEGPPPQNFKEDEQVVAIGILVSSQNLEASQLLVKCPSKYESGGGSLLTQPIFLTALLLGLAAIVYFVISSVLRKG